MIRFLLKELISEHEFKTGQALSINELSDATGIHRATISKIMNERGCVTRTENIDRLCKFFGCNVEDVMRYVGEDELSQ